MRDLVGRPFRAAVVAGAKAPAYATRIVVAAAAFCAVVLSAQQAPPQRLPVFRGEAVLVIVDAYPQRDGKIIEGLKAGDFQILEDGKPQTVESLEFVRVEPSLSESTRRDPGSVSEMLKEAADPHNRTFVVFLDQLHVHVDGSHFIRRPLVDMLNRLIAPTDLFAVMTQNMDPRALTFGRRLISIEEQLTKYWYWGERGSATTDPTDPMESMLKSCYECIPGSGGPCPNWFVRDDGSLRLLSHILIDRRREDRTLTALEGLIEFMSKLREARTVALAVTGGWRLFPADMALAEEAAKYGPQQPRIGSIGGRISTADPNSGTRTSLVPDCQKELLRLSTLDSESRFRSLLTRANRANVSFYPVNPGGLESFDTPITEREAPPPFLNSRRLTNRINVLRTLAENTDGIAIVSANDLAGGLKRIIDDVSAYYLLGYYTTNTTHDGRYRKIEVKSTSPGVHMRARRGYFAPSDKPARAGIAAAPAGPEAPKGLETALGALGRLRTSADIFAQGSIVGATLNVAVEIASARAGVAPWTGGADVQVIAAPDSGLTLPAVTGKIEPGARGVLIRMPVGERAGAEIAAARLVIKVSAGGETLEDTVELRRTPVDLLGEPELYRGRPAATSPLRPVADLQFRRTERVHVEWAIAGELETRSARLLGRTGQPLAIPVSVTERDIDGRRVLAADLNLAPLSVGDYVIEITAARGATTVVRLVAFRIVQ